MNELLFALLLGGAITGKVVNAVDGRPVPAVTVVLEGTEPSGNPAQVDSYIVETDAEGAFRVENAAAVSYRASVRREGFASPRAVTRVTVEPGQPVSAFTIRLTPLGAISGRVADADGDPIAEAVVEALRYSWATGKKELRLAGMVRTNDVGEYRLFGLEPGRYRLRASQSSRAVGSSSRYLTIRGSKVEQAYGVTYFPAAHDAGGAAELDLGPGGELRDISVQLRPQLLYRIRATVTGGNTAAASQVAIGISDLSDGRVASGISMSGSGPGYGRTFTLPPSKPGVYLVWASDRQQNLRAQQVVTVTDADVEVTLTVAPVLALSGTVRVRGEGRVALDAVRLRLEGDSRGSTERARFSRMAASPSHNCNRQPTGCAPLSRPASTCNRSTAATASWKHRASIWRRVRRRCSSPWRPTAEWSRAR